VPAIGFGTWQIGSDSETKEAVLHALGAGYRVIDTARIYGNEPGVGEAIRESGVPREDIFVTTKLWNDDQGYGSTLRACRVSLEKLGLDYLDLYLIHWPATSKRHDSWRAMGRLLSDGKIKAAGVSNFTIDHLQDLMKRSELLPAVNQVEFHPFIYEEQKALLKYCADQGIVAEAYSPLHRLGQERVPVIEKIARRHNKSPQQIVLRWCIQHGTLPLTRSTNPAHIDSNFDVFGFKLTKEDMKAIDALSDGERVTWDPTGMG
jgi:diketogulonate reductase-like aldo/keto reductase